MWELPVERLAALVWWYFMRDADEKARLKFRSRLWVPPKDRRDAPIPKESPWSAENENKAFDAFRAQTGL